jgi:Fur family peroxide stress response transcriptional regulator
VRKLTSAKDILHDHHLKATRPRQKILEYLMEHHNHPTVDTIYTDLAHDQQLNKATIYNTLNTLISVGIVIEIKNGDNSTHYDFFMKPHFHIICKNCGKISDVFYPNFDQIENKMRVEAEKQTGFNAFSSHLEIYGLCSECQKLEKKAQKNS